MAGDELSVVGNPSAASTPRKWDRPLIEGEREKEKDYPR